jgi:hypothetical protein
MNLKDFDYKQFLLEKGEKLGVAIAGTVMVLLIVTGLFLPSHGFFSASPKKNAEELSSVAKNLDRTLDDPNNKPKGTDLPPPDAKDNLINLNTTKVDGKEFPLAGLFEGHRIEAVKRRLPELKNIDDGRVAYAAVPVDGYVFSPDRTQLYALKPLAGAPAAGATGGMAPGLRGPGGPPRPGMGGGRPGTGPGGFRGGMPGQARGLEDRKKQYDVVPLKLEDLSKSSGLSPARQLYPLRMAIIAATFPLRAQLEEFRAKMQFGSIDDVLAQQVTTKDGKSQPAVHFLGVRVQRRTLDPSGKVVQDYQDLDLANAYRPWLFITGRRYEPEDPKLAFVRWPGLIMPKLLEFHLNPAAREFDKSDIDSHYPDVEDKVENIIKTLNSLKTNETHEVTIPPQFKSDEAFDPFRPQGVEDPGVAPRRPPMGAPGAGGPPAGFGPPGGSGPAGGPPFRKGGGQPGRPTQPTDNEAGGPRNRTTTPEHCLVRLIDITIEPGQIYQYRVQVRMGNPLQGRTDVANPDWAQAEELKPDKKSEWFEIPQTVAVPPELAYYAVDQKELEKGYKGPNAGALNPSTDTTLQIHRWLDAVKIEGMGIEPWLIGEWAVADRVIVSRGEYVDRTVRIELPVWSYAQNTFVIGTDHTNKKANLHGINVDFKNNHPKKYQTILIDYEGGRQTYKGSLRVDEDNVKELAVSDTSGTDVLLMDPDGNLLGHNSIVDSEDPERIHRREQVQARVERVKNKGATQPAGTRPGEKPFGK